jgi:hypothetical protein
MRFSSLFIISQTGIRVTHQSVPTGCAIDAASCDSAVNLCVRPRHVIASRTRRVRTCRAQKKAIIYICRVTGGRKTENGSGVEQNERHTDAAVMATCDASPTTDTRSRDNDNQELQKIPSSCPFGRRARPSNPKSSFRQHASEFKSIGHCASPYRGVGRRDATAHRCAPATLAVRII